MIYSEHKREEILEDSPQITTHQL